MIVCRGGAHRGGEDFGLCSRFVKRDVTPLEPPWSLSHSHLLSSLVISSAAPSPTHSFQMNVRCPSPTREAPLLPPPSVLTTTFSSESGSGPRLEWIICSSSSRKSERAISLHGVSSVYTRCHVNQFGDSILEARAGLFLAVHSFCIKHAACVCFRLLCYRKTADSAKRKTHFNFHSAHLRLSTISAGAL